MIRARRALAYSFALNLILAVAAVLHGLLRTGNPSRYFGEGRWTTAVSCLQLVVIAGFAFQTFRLRRAATNERGPALWLLISAGFVFLAADDAFQLHERADILIHRTFHWKGSAITDRIDDAIIVLYAVIGMFVLWLYRAELRRFGGMLRALAVGGVCAGASMACDALSNRPDVFFWLTGNMDVARKLEGWGAVGDGAFQLLAIGCFMAAFYLAWAEARRWARDAAALPCSPAQVPLEPKAATVE